MKELLASIDIGAHSARMLIAEVTEDGMSYDTLEDLEISAPLGADVFRSGKISDDSVTVMCGILRNFKQKMDEYSITKYRAIATSAVREAENADVFLERMWFLTGIQLEILSGSDEARLLSLSIRPLLPSEFRQKSKRLLMADIGTGACQVSSYDCGVMRFTETVRFGTLRLGGGDSVSPALRKERLLPIIDATFREISYLSGKLDCSSLIITGGSVRAILLLRDRPLSQNPVHTLTLSEFERIKDTAETMAENELCEKYNLRPDVAETILPCCMIVESLIRITDAKSIFIPMISTKHALLENYIREFRQKKDPFEPQLLGMAIQTAVRYGGDREMVTDICIFAEKLFLKLKPLHGMEHRSLLLLKVAALLYKTGLFISNSSYHKHSAYIIRNTELPGLSQREREIVALIARYHRKSMPKPQHTEFAQLPREDRTLVNRLAAILRLACGLALSRTSENTMTVTIRPGLVTVKMAGGSGISTWSAVDTSLFRYAFATDIVFL
ncbi:MAG: hypothetical protein IKB25_14205 [Lentisphaeria bacterium]|nr:hypothetical protein [Lentisphaeria bacterium]